VIRRKRLIAIALMVAIVTLLDAPVIAQEIGNATRGWKLAIRTCADCHWVRNARKLGSPRAPTLSAIATVKGMSAMALNVALLTSHRSIAEHHT
jgi:hypothetical protein